MSTTAVAQPTDAARQSRRTAVTRQTRPGDMSHRQILEAMTGLLVALFTATLSSTIVATALPTIIGDLHGTQRQYTWVITASLLATTVTTPIWGKLSDLFSKKLLVQIAIVVFVIGSVGAGFAHTVPFLIACRVVQGLGLGGLTALVQSIMGSIIAPRERGRYSGYLGAVVAVSTVSGPLLGGLIVDSPLGWRWCFFVCIPLALVSLFVVQSTLKIATVRRTPKIDYLGAVLISGVASLPLLWITFAGHDFAWISWQTAAYLGSAALLLILAVVVELKVPEPLVPLRLLSNRTSVLVIVASVAVGVSLFAGTTFLGQYFQLARGYSPTHAGLLTIPLMAALLVSSTGTGQIISRTGRWKRFLVAGAVFLVIGLVGLGSIDHGTPIWQIGISMALLGLGLGAMSQNLVLAVQNTVDMRDIGAVSATVAFFRTLGGAVGVSVLGAVLATQVQSSIAAGLSRLGGFAGSGGGTTSTLDLKALPAPVLDIVRAAYGDATGHIFLIGACCAAVALVAVLFVREVPLRTTVGLTPAAEGSTAAESAAEVTSIPQHAADVSTGSDRPTDFDPESLDDPSQRLAVAALDVLAAAQDQARQHLAASENSHLEVADLLDGVGAEVDQAAAAFHARLDAIKARLVAQDSGASLGRDGVGGDSLRSYEYGLLLNSQRTADKVTRLAKTEAERVLTNADEQLAELERRISALRKVEQDLQDRVSERLRTQR
jgi:EmrB/QacA subfamily drug resistance transporter